MKVFVAFLLPFLLFADAVLVTTDQVRLGEIRETSNFLAVVRFVEKPTISSEVNGVVTNIAVDIGDSFVRGDLLASIDSRVIDSEVLAKEAELSMVQAQLNQAEKEAKRAETLFVDQAISDQEFEQYKLKKDELEAKHKITKAELNILKTTQQKHTIKAPFDGKVASRFAHKGDYLKSGDNILTIANSKNIELISHLPIEIANLIRADQQVVAEISDQLITTKVKAISPSSDEVSKLVAVRFELTNIDAKENQKATIQIPTKTAQNALLISRDAVVKRNGRSVVFAVISGRAKMIDVEIIGFDGMQAGVRSKELKAGMELIVNGLNNISADQEVKVTR